MEAITAPAHGHVTYDAELGHVCTCTKSIAHGECDGHPAGPFDPMGETVYCDGTCNQLPTYDQTVSADRSVEPTQSGSWFYVCERCGAGAWSGC